MGVSVKSNFTGAFKKIERKTKRTQFILDQQIVKDSNYYAPFADGLLIGSALIASDFGKGKLVWDTPYSRRMYWNPQYNFSTDKNPNAGGKWFERAKAEHLSEWLQIAQSEVSK
ncbi:minor capsid protein [Carnobacterium pleistocenium]|uniref:minor capsid protein n=1 Tax=Carnobacterium pleistocenium TaxID=181073 RepID=UPI00055812EE|nr:minor capsid protein [Carnobacterium pleistocenium]